VCFHRDVNVLVVMADNSDSLMEIVGYERAITMI
jgi:hypothetical protein